MAGWVAAFGWLAQASANVNYNFPFTLLFNFLRRLGARMGALTIQCFRAQLKVH